MFVGSETTQLSAHKLGLDRWRARAEKLTWHDYHRWQSMGWRVNHEIFYISDEIALAAGRFFLVAVDMDQFEVYKLQLIAEKKAIVVVPWDRWST